MGRVNNIILLILEGFVLFLCDGELEWKLGTNQMGLNNTSFFSNKNNDHSRLKQIMLIHNHKHCYPIWYLNLFCGKLMPSLKGH